MKSAINSTKNCLEGQPPKAELSYYKKLKRLEEGVDFFTSKVQNILTLPLNNIFNNKISKRR
jgi:hypothetical protein